jgi:hypothetical protein
LTITQSWSGTWRACVGFRGVGLKPLPEAADIGRVDRGIWVSAALPDGTLLMCPPFLKEARAQIAELQRQREQYEKFSPEWKRINKAVAKTYAKAHRRSENWARHCAIEIVARYGVIELPAGSGRSTQRIRPESASPVGTQRRPTGAAPDSPAPSAGTKSTPTSTRPRSSPHEARLPRPPGVWLGVRWPSGPCRGTGGGRRGIEPASKRATSLATTPSSSTGPGRLLTQQSREGAI